ncbi:MAG TPA: transposase [Bacteroidia bacterium]|nr:transposase [Bacteroidia bacterium]
MSEKYKIFPGGLYFVTMTVVGWIDVFTRAVYCDEIIANLNYCIENKGLRIYAFVIMPSHIHLIAKVENEGNLSDILRDFKSHTSKKIISMIEESESESRKEWLLYMFEFFGKKQIHNKKYQFWQQNNHAFDLFSNKFIDQKFDYIHNNPVEARIVTEPSYYVYSSANEFTNLKLYEF